jgi:hypothetical protein
MSSVEFFFFPTKKKIKIYNQRKFIPSKVWKHLVIKCGERQEMKLRRSEDEESVRSQTGDGVGHTGGGFIGDRWWR